MRTSSLAIFGISVIPLLLLAKLLSASLMLAVDKLLVIPGSRTALLKQWKKI